MFSVQNGVLAPLPAAVLTKGIVSVHSSSAPWPGNQGGEGLEKLITSPP